MPRKVMIDAFLHLCLWHWHYVVGALCIASNCREHATWDPNFCNQRCLGDEHTVKIPRICPPSCKCPRPFFCESYVCAHYQEGALPFLAASPSPSKKKVFFWNCLVKPGILRQHESVLLPIPRVRILLFDGFKGSSIFMCSVHSRRELSRAG